MKDTILHNREIEKPTAAAYYKNMLSVLNIPDVTTEKLKAKVANLKTLYLKAVDWRGKTGEGLLITDPHGGEQSVKEYLKKLCPYFESLDEIYGTRASVVPPHIHSSDSQDDDVGFEAVNSGELVATFDIQDLPVPSCSRSHSTSTVADIKKKLCVEPKSWKKGIQKGSLVALTEIQTKRIESLNAKVELDQKRFEAESDYRQAQLQLEREKYESEASHRQNDLDMKKFEIETAARLKILELEKEERVSKFKIEQEIKLQLELAKLKPA